MQQQLKSYAAKKIFKMWTEDNRDLLYRHCGGLRAGCECSTCKDVQWTLDNHADDLFKDYVDMCLQYTLDDFKYWCDHRLANGWG